MIDHTEYAQNRTPISHRHAGIDFLRAVAILWVMAYHLDGSDLRLPAWTHHGWMGVDLFFVLSGYLIGLQVLRPYGAGRQPDWGLFFQRRAWRILPAYLAVLALYLAVPAWRESDAMAPLWQFLTFTTNLLPDYARQRAFSHAWSLCVEEHFYLLLPAVVWLLARAPDARRVAGCAVLLLIGGIVLRGWAWYDAVAPAIAAGGDGVLAYVERIYNPTWNRLDGLWMGVVLASVRVFRGRWWTALMARGWLLLLFGALGMAASLALDFTSAAGAMLGFPLLSASLACLLGAVLSDAMTHWRWPGARAVATLAYCLYLTNKQVFYWVDAHADLDAMPALALKLLAAFVVAGVLHLLVERPGLARGVQVSHRRQLPVHF
ncbi:acyltransferase family protein [Massilia sp. S19_KUP03_FR1]|uniref:acyltransferase family protein n=1 Tax=Massilia sp. S19_KUP03_FR1 TaxID=3025503 RepID=UPI002FCD8F9E